MVTEKSCAQCGAPADAALIFCKKCGAVLRPPVPLLQPTAQDANRSPSGISSMKRIVVTVVKAIAGIAAVVFIFCPLSTGTQILAFVGSIAVFLICHSLLTNLDEEYVDEHMKNGYWPPKPVDWSSLPDRHASSEKRAEGRES
jgi:hypothetical protein